MSNLEKKKKDPAGPLKKKKMASSDVLETIIMMC